MRKKPALIWQDSYTPNHLLDLLMEKLKVTNDASLARALKVPPSTISKIRHKQVAVNSELLLEAHELTEMSIRELRVLMGDVHTKYWLGKSAANSAPAQMPKLSGFRQQTHRDFGTTAHAA